MLMPSHRIAAGVVHSKRRYDEFARPWRQIITEPGQQQLGAGEQCRRGREIVRLSRTSPIGGVARG